MKAYRIVSRDDSQSLAEYLTENGQSSAADGRADRSVADGDR